MTRLISEVKMEYTMKHSEAGLKERWGIRNDFLYPDEVLLLKIIDKEYWG